VSRYSGHDITARCRALPGRTAEGGCPHMGVAEHDVIIRPAGIANL